ncbi:hypothetical protein A2U01_0086588, partial [Trifolium medium]|nr:hypothetical protein [Trifolium medium]
MCLNSSGVTPRFAESFDVEDTAGMLEPPLLVGTSDSDIISSQFIPLVEEEVLSFEAVEGSTVGTSESFDPG